MAYPPHFTVEDRSALINAIASLGIAVNTLALKLDDHETAKAIYNQIEDVKKALEKLSRDADEGSNG